MKPKQFNVCLGKMASKVIVRMALPTDAQVLAELTAVSLGPYKVNWHDATHDWMVAELDGKVYGCVQLCLGRPIGRVEMLCVDPTLNPREKHAIMLELMRGGLFALQQTGSQVITVFGEFNNKGFKRLIKKRFGAKVTNSGNLLTTYLGG